MHAPGPSSLRSPPRVLAVVFGLVATGGCVDKTPPPLWPTPPPPPLATPIGLAERPDAAAGGQGGDASAAEVVEPAPAPAAGEPTKAPDPPDAIGPWQPGRTHR